MTLRTQLRIATCAADDVARQRWNLPSRMWAAGLGPLPTWSRSVGQRLFRVGLVVGREAERPLPERGFGAARGLGTEEDRAGVRAGEVVGARPWVVGPRRLCGPLPGSGDVAVSVHDGVPLGFR